MFPQVDAPDPLLITALRAHGSFPALVATLERAGVTAPGTISAAAARAQGVADIGDDQSRTLALTFFQAAIGIIDRIVRSGGLSSAEADGLITRLAAVDHSARGYGARIATWIQKDLLATLPVMNDESPDALEDTLLAAMAGVRATETRDRVVEWEGRRYRVNAARGEELRLHRVRERQGGASLQAALQSAQQTKKPGGERVLADALTSILYAAYLGAPDGPALAAGNVALQHDLGAGGVLGPRYPWRLPTEGHSGKGWRVSGSLLGLDAALARLSLRRLDSMVMPPEPRMVSSERQTAALTVVLQSPIALSDAARDEIAAALARGRARLETLQPSEADVDEAARDAGLSAWRREGLRWILTNDSANRSTQLSAVELMWLGRPRPSSQQRVRCLGRGDAATDRLPLPGDARGAAVGEPERTPVARDPGDSRRRRFDHRRRHARRAWTARTGGPGRDRLRHAGSARPVAPHILRRLVRIQPRGERALPRPPD